MSDTPPLDGRTINLNEDPRGHRVRVAQRGWIADRAASSLEEVSAGVGVYWVEIDGHRFEHVGGIEFEARQGEFSVPVLRLPIIGSLEVVYLDQSGNELGSVPTEVEGSHLEAKGASYDRFTLVPGSEDEQSWRADPGDWEQTIEEVEA